MGGEREWLDVTCPAGASGWWMASFDEEGVLGIMGCCLSSDCSFTCKQASKHINTDDGNRTGEYDFYLR